LYFSQLGYNKYADHKLLVERDCSSSPYSSYYVQQGVCISVAYSLGLCGSLKTIVTAIENSHGAQQLQGSTGQSGAQS